MNIFFFFTITNLTLEKETPMLFYTKVELSKRQVHFHLTCFGNNPSTGTLH